LPEANSVTTVTRTWWRAQTFLAKGPAYAITYGRWQFRQRWQALSDRLTPAWPDDAALLDAVDLRREELRAVERAARQRDRGAARQALVDHFTHRTRPVFHFGLADKAAIVSAVGDEQRAATLRAADDVCRHVFQFRHLGPVQFGAEIEWDACPQANVDWMWDLNRHAYFNTLGRAYWYTGDQRYAEEFVRLLLDWIRRNPPRASAPNWKSVLELAARLSNWMWAYHFFRHADAFTADAHLAFLTGLLVLARHLFARMEYHATNNHLFLEAKALAMCGVLFPEFKEAARWRETGLRVLWRQVTQQVCADGVHAERSTLYHRAVTSELLELAVLLDNNGLSVPDAVVDRLTQMIDFDVNVTKPDGTIPLLGDSSLADTYVRFSGRHARAVLFDRLRLDGDAPHEETTWLLARHTTQPQPQADRGDRVLASKPFADGGYFVMRGGEGSQSLYLVFDCGPFGHRPVPNHGHADALSFDLYAYGRTLITDCGAYSYYLGEQWRNYFRGTRAHNTIAVDGQDQSLLVGARHVYRMARAGLHRWVSNADFDFVDGAHDGYRRLAQPVTHRRCILFVKPEYWIVFDVLTGEGIHTLAQHFHLMPWAVPHVDSDSGTVRADDGDGSPALTLAPTTPSLHVDAVAGATDPIQGWVSFYSGEKVAAPVVTYRRTVQLPVVWCTVLYPHPPGRFERVRVGDFPVRADDGDTSRVKGVRVETGEHVDTCIVDVRARPARTTFAGGESDAPLVYVRTRKSDASVVKTARLDATRTVLEVEHCADIWPCVNISK
jgi:uncharacterized heparinase superfamily protein